MKNKGCKYYNLYGINPLKNAIRDMAMGKISIDPQRSLVPNLRQKLGLESALDSLQNALSGLGNGAGEELLLMDFAMAQQSLEQIIGNTVDTDILDGIFNKFCIGK